MYKGVTLLTDLWRENCIGEVTRETRVFDNIAGRVLNQQNERNKVSIFPIYVLLDINAMPECFNDMELLCFPCTRNEFISWIFHTIQTISFNNFIFVVDRLVSFSVACMREQESIFVFVVVVIVKSFYLHTFTKLPT